MNMTKAKKKTTVNTIRFKRVDFDMSSIPSTDEWIEKARDEVVCLRMSALTLQRFDDKGLTEAVSASDDSVETFEKMADQLLSLKKEYESRLKLVDTASARILVALGRAAEQQAA
jgi:hypothetical protein